MNPDPAVVLTIVATSVSGAAILVGFVVLVARFVAPRLEGWCARHDNRFIAALAMSEDAGLPWAAKRRARALFLSKLSERQRRSWHTRRRFEVIAAGGRRYSISDYRPFNIRSGGALFCIQVSGQLPIYDKLLAQKLLIEGDEQLFLARCNVRAFSGKWEPLMAEARARYPLT